MSWGRITPAAVGLAAAAEVALRHQTDSVALLLQNIDLTEVGHQPP
jgi:hypothetical protein